jgi:S-adenosylmethionine:tRNA ribosyltransferase-isomerase
MKRSELLFNLPPHLIAANPAQKRGDDRLMVIDKKKQSIRHSHFLQLADELPPGALLVFNDSKVRKSRLFGKNEGGGLVEFLLIRPLENEQWLCVVSKARRQRPGRHYSFGGQVSAVIAENYAGGLKIVRFENLTEEFIEQHGHMPLPPYIKRDDTLADNERYQTVYARELGSSAAPTAGLHFTKEILADLKERGFEECFVTLHVGLGTFAPIRADELSQHTMHTESYEISFESALAINRAVDQGRPVVAIGTTSLRVLESAAGPGGHVRAGADETDIFIYGAYRFKVISGLFTNFHTPESTLLALVQSFGGKELMVKAYDAAIEAEYKFFSYGDCMLIK